MLFYHFVFDIILNDRWQLYTSNSLINLKTNDDDDDDDGDGDEQKKTSI